MFTRLKPDLSIYLGLLIGAVGSFLLMLLNFNQAIGNDWYYFDSLNLLTRSIVFNYHKFPMHDPWVLGGMDILANPQSRVFSPFFLFDLLFNPDTANKLSLIVLSIIGTWGCFKLLRHLEISKNISFVCSLIFINASWFGLHYAEGHITFGPFQLIALAFYFILRLRKAKYIFLFSLLNAFFILHGAIYMFIFTFFLLLITLCLSINGLSFKNLFIAIGKEWKMSLLSFLVFLLLTSTKFVPIYLLDANRTPLQPFYCMDNKFILDAFFNPFQYKDKPCGNEVCYFHEFGCYLGLIASCLLTCFILVKKNFLKFYKYLILGFLFLFIGSGKLESINPYKFIQQIPLVNNADVQSRYFILFFLAFIILLANSLDWLKTKIPSLLFLLLILFLAGESFFVKNYPFYDTFYKKKDFIASNYYNPLITSTTIDSTVNYEETPYIYCRKNTGTANTYEASQATSYVKSKTDKDYKGEIYLLDGISSAQLLSYVPGEIQLSFATKGTTVIQLNTNYLLGWKVKEGNASVYSENSLLTVKPNTESGIITLTYKPPYFRYVVLSYILGMLLALSLFLGNRKTWSKLKQPK